MAEIIHCPECDSQLRVPGPAAGKKYRCKSCGSVFTVRAGNEAGRGAGKAPPTGSPRRSRQDEEDEDEEDEEDEDEDEEDEDEEDLEARLRRRGPQQQVGETHEWEKVRKGLTLILNGIYLAILSIIIPTAGLTLISVLPVDPRALAVMTLAVCGVSSLMQLVAYGLWVTGHIFCVFAPSHHGAKILAIIALLLMGASLLGSFAGVLIAGITGAWASTVSPSAALAASGAGVIVASVGWLLYFSQVIVFLFFLRSVGLCLLEEGLSRSIIYLLILALVTFVLLLLYVAGYFLAIGSMIALGPEGISFGGAIGLVIVFLVIGGFLLVLTLTWFIWYIAVIVQMRRAVSRRVEGVRKVPPRHG